jgi:hypothetical protein
MLRERRVSRDQFGSSDEVKSSRGQHRHVQRLADMARGFRSIRMLVKETAARREIQQDGASKHRQSAARNRPSEHSLTPSHDLPR